jgi:hypothetical protein
MNLRVNPSVKIESNCSSVSGIRSLPKAKWDYVIINVLKYNLNVKMFIFPLTNLNFVW